LVLVASTSSRQPGGWILHRAFWIATRSAAGGVPGATVIVVDLERLSAVIVTAVLAATAVVDTSTRPHIGTGHSRSRV
jgi:hypothetical protein